MTSTASQAGLNTGLAVIEELEEFQKARYEGRDIAPAKAKEEYRDYEAEARASVKEFYRLNHQG